MPAGPYSVSNRSNNTQNVNITTLSEDRNNEAVVGTAASSSSSIDNEQSKYAAASVSASSSSSEISTDETVTQAYTQELHYNVQKPKKRAHSAWTSIPTIDIDISQSAKSKKSSDIDISDVSPKKKTHTQTFLNSDEIFDIHALSPVVLRKTPITYSPTAEFQRIQVDLWKLKHTQTTLVGINNIQDDHLGVFGNEALLAMRLQKADSLRCSTSEDASAKKVGKNSNSTVTSRTSSVASAMTGSDKASTSTSEDDDMFSRPKLCFSKHKFVRASAVASGATVIVVEQKKSVQRKRYLSPTELRKHIIVFTFSGTCDRAPTPCELCTLMLQTRTLVDAHMIPDKLLTTYNEQGLLFENSCVTSASRLFMHDILRAGRVTICHDRYVRYLMSRQLDPMERTRMLTQVAETLVLYSTQTIQNHALIVTRKQLLHSGPALLQAQQYVINLYSDDVCKRRIDRLFFDYMSVELQKEIVNELSREQSQNAAGNLLVLLRTQCNSKPILTDKLGMQQSIEQISIQTQNIRDKYAHGTQFIFDRINKQPLTLLYTCFSVDDVVRELMNSRSTMNIQAFHSIMVRMANTVTYVHKAMRVLHDNRAHNPFMQSIDCLRCRTANACMSLVSSNSNEMLDSLNAHYVYAKAIIEFFSTTDDSVGRSKAYQYLNNVHRLMSMRHVRVEDMSAVLTNVHTSYTSLIQYLQFTQGFTLLDLSRRKSTYVNCNESDVFNQCIIHNAYDVSMGRVTHIVQDALAKARREAFQGLLVIFRALFSCNEIQQYLERIIVLFDAELKKRSLTLIHLLQEYKLLHLHEMCTFESNYCNPKFSNNCTACVLIGAGHYELYGTSYCMSTQCLTFAIDAACALFKNIAEPVTLSEITSEMLVNRQDFSFTLAFLIFKKVREAPLQNSGNNFLEERIMQLFQQQVVSIVLE